MNLLYLFILTLFLIQIINDVLTVPIPQQADSLDYEIEDRRRKHKRKRRPCTRNSNGDARWFFGHDLTLFLGDVTICGYPNNHGDNPSSNDDTFSGIFGGVVPTINRPHKPHRPLKPHKPFKPQRPDSSVKPVDEQVDEDYPQDNYYKPGPLVGVVNNQVVGQEQNLSNFSPTRIFNTLSRHFNKFVNPFIDLLYK